MAQKVEIILVDDLDGEKADETVGFAVDGVRYEIDLSTKNAKKLRDSLAVYVAEGRKVSGRKRASRRTGAQSETPAQIRAWARESGFDVPARGRVSSEVRAAYAAAH